METRLDDFIHISIESLFSQFSLSALMMVYPHVHRIRLLLTHRIPLQSFSNGLAKLCDERFAALLAEPRGEELLEPRLRTARSSLGSPEAAEAVQGKAALEANSATASSEGDEGFDIG